MGSSPFPGWLPLSSTCEGCGKEKCRLVAPLTKKHEVLAPSRSRSSPLHTRQVMNSLAQVREMFAEENEACGLQAQKIQVLRKQS